MVCQEQRFCSILTGTFLWNPMPETDKSIVIAEIGCREKILSERIPLNGQWNNRTSQTWPEKGHGREGRSRTSFFFLQNWRNQKTEQNWNPRVFIGPAVILPDLSICISFSLG
jgi:hypothetical protein